MNPWWSFELEHTQIPKLWLPATLMYAVDLHVASIMVFTVLKFPNVENCKLSSYFAFFKAKTKIKKVVKKVCYIS